jgi:hypothetical protein
MKKTLLVAIFASLLLSSFFVSSATADNVSISIQGGFGCTIIILNNENHTITANVSIVSYKLFREGTNVTGYVKVKPGEAGSLRSLPPGIESIYAMCQVGNLTVTRKGISIFYFVILFR